MSENPFQLPVIIDSVREGRFGARVAQWFVSRVEQRDDIKIDVIELADTPLSTVQQAHPVPTGEYTSADVRAFAARIGDADAFVFVTPEYNHSYPGPLKLAIDLVHPEWRAKLVGFVSYGGLAGRQRSVERLRPVFSELHAVTIRDTASLNLFNDPFDDNGDLVTLPSMPPPPSCSTNLPGGHWHYAKHERPAPTAPRDNSVRCFSNR